MDSGSIKIVGDYINFGDEISGTSGYGIRNNNGIIEIKNSGGGWSSGLSGYSGHSGISGYSGISGISGYSGISGISGISGYSGISGISGISGYSGISGISGYSGISGISGISGYSGISGISGYSGISGISGYSGRSGYSGINGTSGLSGYSGINGTSGLSGYSGINGTSGLSGYSGISGPAGGAGTSGYSGVSGISGYSGAGTVAGATVTIATTAADGTDNNSQIYFKNGTPQTLAVIWHSSQSAPEQSPDTHGRFTSGKVYNSIWNDLADFLELEEPLESIEYGKVYIRADNKVSTSKNYCELGIIGIATDTFGYGCGTKGIGNREIPISIAGFVLAFVDKVYLSGTPLTCTRDGYLTEILPPDKLLYPERIVATFYKEEINNDWNGIIVNGRMWVKII